MASELDEIWALYQDDGGDSLRAAEEALETLGREPAERKAIAALFRALHTFKGNSRILGLVNIERVAHFAEDLIGLTRDYGVSFDRKIGAALIEAVDVLRGMMEHAVSAHADAPAGQGDAICERLQALHALRERAQAPEPVEQEPEPPSEDVVYFDSAAAPIGEDEGYLQIFLEFAGDALAQLRRADPAAMLETFGSVSEAAERLGLAAWREAAESFLAAGDIAARAASVVALNRLYREATGEDAAAAEGDDLPEAARLAAAAATLAPRREWTRAPQPEVARAKHQLAEAARLRGLHVVAETAEALSATQDLEAYEETLFALHDGLKLWVESGDPALAPALAALGDWSVGQGPATLGRLALALADEPEALDWAEIAAKTRRLTCILSARGGTQAAELAARIGDLVARLAAGEQAADAATLRALASFVAALKPLIAAPADAARDAAGLARAEAALADLFRPSAIDELIAGLDIPPAFIESLSPEAALAAREAAGQGLNMHVVRADTERRPALAEAFFGFLSGVRVISTVTVFDGDATLFDFLIACPLDAAAAAKALAGLDPGGQGLKLMQTRVAPPAPPESASAEPPAFAMMLEALGAVATAQAGARRLAERLVEGDAPAALKSELERLAQWQAQIGDSLEQLQQELMTSQLRPAAPLMQELREAVLVRARAGGVALEVALKGEAGLVDGESLAGLALSAPALIAAAVDDALAGPAPKRAELTLTQSESRFALTLRIDGASAGAALRAIRGEATALTSGEPGFRLTLPRAIALIDGLVMRVGAVRYAAPIRAVQRILRVGAGERLAISASGGVALRIDARRVAPIVRLPRAGEESAGADLYVIVGERGELAALEVDEILGQEPLLVRPLAGYLGAIGAAAGCAVLSDGAVGVALDLGRLFASRSLAA